MNTVPVYADSENIRLNRFLPYLAVLQADLKQTARSWLYRTWVLLSLFVAVGYVLYRFGAYRETGMVQSASVLMTDIVRWLVLGSVTLIIVLSSGCVSSERGTMADSVLSRGISRRQYFLGKWHSRLISVIGTFVALGSIVLLTSAFLLPGESITVTGCLVAMALVASILSVIVTCGAAVSAMVSSTLLSIAIVWMVLYGVGFVLTFFPDSHLSPEQIITSLPHILHGHYDPVMVRQIVTHCLAICLGLAGVGMFVFSRRDV